MGLKEGIMFRSWVRTFSFGRGWVEVWFTPEQKVYLRYRYHGMPGFRVLYLWPFCVRWGIYARAR